MSGVHFLSCPAVIDRLVRAADLGDGDLVVDFGAGPGAITAPLARTGSRVLAVERDTRFASALRRRFDDRPSVRVVHGDLRAVRLPRRAFTVVASIPFAVSTPLLRRLLTPVGGGFSRAELIVEWGLAKRLTAARPRDPESAWWATRFALTVRRRVPARCFSPPPRVDAAHLAVRRRSDVDTRVASILWVLLDAAYARPRDPARVALRGVAPKRATHRLFGSQPVSEVRTDEWVALARVLAADRGIVPPRLPRHLSDRGAFGTCVMP